MGGAELRGSCEDYFDDISYLLMVRGESAGIDPRNILVAARQCTVQHYSWPTQLEQLYDCTHLSNMGHPRLAAHLVPP